MAHSHHHHREHQVSHRRVHHVLKHEPSGAMQHNDGHAFSKVTSKTAAENHDGFVATGNKAPKRYARGGKVGKGHGKSHQTNVNIVIPHHQAAPPMPGGPMPGGPMPGGAPGGAPPMMPPPGAGGPPGMPPGMPMHARGGAIKKSHGGYIAGEGNSEANLKKWSKRASDNSYFRGGAASGVGREEKAAHQKHGKHK